MHCKLLEKHIHINVSGRYQSCCISTDVNNSQTIYTHSPSEWLNSDILSCSRELLKNNQWPPQCGICKEKEDKGYPSHRLSFEKESTGKKGLLLDLRFDNSCNLKCISCGPWCSSSILKEAKEMQEQNIITIYPNILPKNDNWGSSEFIANRLDSLQIEEVKFAGGEPMMIKYIPDLLERLDSDVRIKFVSNLTLFNPKIFNLLKKFKNVNIMASIDAVGKRAEYIRYGSKWTELQENIKRYSEVARVEYVNTTVSALNILYLPELEEWADKQKMSLTFIFLTDPQWLNLKNAPDVIKNAGNKRFNFWNSEGDPALIEKFKSNIIKLDTFRGVHIRDYLPEVADAYGM